MLATTKQLAYLQDLTDKAELIKQLHPSLVPQGLTHQVWQHGMTSEKASARIDYYNAILNKCYQALFPWLRSKQAQDDLPE